MRTGIFISYSHKDRKWLERLKIHLKPVAREYNIEIWEDTKITPGAKWREEINRAVESAGIAILLISADFLASDFIVTDELPPLLRAAEDEGATILPVIISPCSFIYTKGLSQFQAVNDPSQSIVLLSKGKQEKVFLKVAETIYHRQIQKEVLTEVRPSALPEDVNRGESFLLPTHWSRLVKMGDWILDSHKKRIVGAGMFTYLLSRQEYGKTPFAIRARIEFSNFDQHVKSYLGIINAGIVLGWNSNPVNPSYYNILITGTRLLLERIGFNGGDAYRDYEHLDEGTSFHLKENSQYVFAICLDSSHIDVFIDEQFTYSFSRPNDLSGRVGLRPWRSQIECSYFEVSEN